MLTKYTVLYSAILYRIISYHGILSNTVLCYMTSQRRCLEEQRGATGRRGVHGQVEGNAPLTMSAMVDWCKVVGLIIFFPLGCWKGINIGSRDKG